MVSALAATLAVPDPVWTVTGGSARISFVVRRIDWRSGVRLKFGYSRLNRIRFMLLFAGRAHFVHLIIIIIIVIY